jgi:hypothetical protein
MGPELTTTQLDTQGFLAASHIQCLFRKYRWCALFNIWNAFPEDTFSSMYKPDSI